MQDCPGEIILISGLKNYFDMQIFFKDSETGFVENMKNHKSHGNFKKSRVLRTPLLPDVRAGCFRLNIFEK